jgi:hypothetical protein
MSRRRMGCRRRMLLAQQHCRNHHYQNEQKYFPQHIYFPFAETHRGLLTIQMLTFFF